MTKTAAIAALMCAAAAGAVRAETYPARPIQILVPFTAGNTVDITGRAFADAFKDQIGGTVVIVNRDGAGGMVAMGALANSKPDGYTLFYGPNGQLTLQPHLRKNLPYKAQQIAPICRTFESPFAVVVRPDSPIKSFQELIAAAKAAPGKVSYGLSGIGSVPHLLFYTVAARAAAEFNAVAYKNYSLVVPDTMAGRLDFAVMSFGSFQSPPLRILAVLREQRHPHFPDAPSSTELGFPAKSAAFGGLYAPAGTPPEILAKLEGACERTAKSDAFRKVLADTGQSTDYEGSAAFAKRLADDSGDKAAAVKQLGLKVE